jgi:hypothetical protein
MYRNWKDYKVIKWIMVQHGNCDACGLGAPDYEVTLSKDGTIVKRWHEVCLPRFVAEEVCESHRRRA